MCIGLWYKLPVPIDKAVMLCCCSCVCSAEVRVDWVLAQWLAVLQEES